jgi:hypothetical protein
VDVLYAAMIPIPLVSLKSDFQCDLQVAICSRSELNRKTPASLQNAFPSQVFMFLPRRSAVASLFCFLFLCGAVLAEPAATPDFPDTDWPWWRGEARDGVAATGQQPPMKWSETENVLWSADIPGRGHGTPILVGDHIYLATADEEKETRSVLCYHRKTGEQLW